MPGAIVIAGGSGFLGRSLARHMADLGHEVVILSRHAPRKVGPWQHLIWDGRTLGPWVSALDGAAAIVNLAGRSVDCIKTPDHCDEILRSRVEATRVLGDAIRAISSPPPVWVQMSTAHIYGDPPECICDEESSAGVGLAPTVGKAWEEAFAAAVVPGQRGVILRTGFVLGPGEGAMKRLGMLARLGLGGRVGSGRQGMSWIHIHDMNRIFERAILDDSMSGLYIASGPNPVSQRDLMRAIRHAMRMPIGLPAPAWLVRLGAKWVLRTDPELALYGRYCVPRRLLSEGFTFEFEHIDNAMHDIVQNRQSQTREHGTTRPDPGRRGSTGSSET